MEALVTQGPEDVKKARKTSSSDIAQTNRPPTDSGRKQTKYQ